MCAACVAQGITYVGGALTTLQVMGARAKAKRPHLLRASTTSTSSPTPDPAGASQNER